LAEIMEVLSTGDPNKLNKSALQNMRAKALDWAAWGIGVSEEQPLVLGESEDQGYLEAVRMVAGYGGRNRFMKDLQRSLTVHGSLTQRQTEAVLDAPDDDLLDELRALGVQNIYQYRWQAMDARTAAKAELRKKAGG
jgi:hypothetical protein